MSEFLPFGAGAATPSAAQDVETRPAHVPFTRDVCAPAGDAPRRGAIGNRLLLALSHDDSAGWSCTRPDHPAHHDHLLRRMA
jgi:hypothetical protein